MRSVWSHGRGHDLRELSYFLPVHFASLYVEMAGYECDEEEAYSDVHFWLGLWNYTPCFRIFYVIETRCGVYL